MAPSLRLDANQTDSLATTRWRAWSIRLAMFFGLAAICLFAASLGYRQQHERTGPTSPVGAGPGKVSKERGGGPSGRDGLMAEAADVATAPPRVPMTRDSNALRWPFWEFRLRQPTPPREPSLTPLTWRMIGASLSGGKWLVIILRQGKTEPEYVGVGEELPGGYRIEAINDQDVTLSKGKQMMVLSYLGSR